MLHVCSLAALPETVRATGASHILTVMANVDQVQRPASVLEVNHLKVSMDDIIEQMDGFVAPSVEHIERVLNFDGERLRRRLRAQSAPRRDRDRPANPGPFADRLAQPADRQPRRQGARTRGADAARAR